MASVTASTTPQTRRASEGDANAPADPLEDTPVSEGEPASASGATIAHTGSLSRRMMVIAAGWISLLLLVGGFALDRTLTALITNNFDEQLDFMVIGMIGSAEIAEGEIFFNRPLGDQRFLEPDSGLYWQVSGEGYDDWPSRSLWDRTLSLTGSPEGGEANIYDSNQFTDEPLRIVERTAIIPGSETRWSFVVAASTEELDAQIAEVRSIVAISFAVLGAGLFLLAVMQTWYGLGPLRRIRAAISRMRTAGGQNRLTDPLPLEVQPLVEELNGLLAYSEKQAEEARTHAGNLAHALKTPLTVVTNAATSESPDLSKTVLREASVMRRQVDHHLARARAVGRRAVGAVANVRESAAAVQRAVERLYPEGRFDLAGSRDAKVAIERQDLEEILGNLIENAAKYGAGSVFTTIDADPDSELCEIWVEDDGTGIPEEERVRIFARGARLDTGKPGTGLGLAIVRDVAEIYGGAVELEESEDLGGLHVILKLPRVEEREDF